MVDIPKKKVGIVACSGEELAEGTVTRLAALKVLEHLRPADTVTICLPLFLAGGEGERAFARYYPTIAVDGCELRCAARATEMYSSRPAASLVVSDLVAEYNLDRPAGLRRLNEAGSQAVEIVAERLANLVDDLIGRQWSRRTGEFIEAESIGVSQFPGQQESVEAACSCGSGIPVRKVMVGEQQVTLVALPLIYEQLRQAGKQPSEDIAQELLETVRIYNPIPAGAEEIYVNTLVREYAVYCSEMEPVA